MTADAVGDGECECVPDSVGLPLPVRESVGLAQGEGVWLLHWLAAR